MALIICPECGKQVSSMATACPECGYPLSSYSNSNEQNPDNSSVESVSDGSKFSKLTKKHRIIASAIVGAIILCVIFFAFKGNNSPYYAGIRWETSRTEIERKFPDGDNNMAGGYTATNSNKRYFDIKGVSELPVFTFDSDDQLIEIIVFMTFDEQNTSFDFIMSEITEKIERNFKNTGDRKSGFVENYYEDKVSKVIITYFSDGVITVKFEEK
ncbi:MAG: zinc-ribbon domain-containing protein [Oscillospiraceae bacterium]|nr:zinc-ribbon domain-containing protein [Oscillospiraceae bacterium]